MPQLLFADATTKGFVHCFVRCVREKPTWEIEKCRERCWQQQFSDPKPVFGKTLNPKSASDLSSIKRA